MKKILSREKYIIFIWFILQLIYVFAKEPCVSVSDEYTYKQIALDIFNGNAVSSFHYPFVYPLVLSVSFIFGKKFYYAMLLINILLKAIFLGIILKLLSDFIENIQNRKLILTLIAFSPSYFFYSDWLMAENLFAPLLVITILWYAKNQKTLVDSQIMLRTKLLYSAIAGFLAVILYETKYLSIILIPIWFVFWFSPYVLNKNKKLLRQGMVCIVGYGLTILIVLGAVVLIYCIKSGQIINVDIIKSSLGFKSGSGPENTHYKMVPEIKWIICYLAYVFLSSGLVFGENIKNYDIPKNVKANIVFIRMISIGLIFVAARHSSFIDYNEGGKMLKLLGRYVAYIALNEIIVYAVCIEHSNVLKRREKNNVVRKLLNIVILIACTVFSYEILYNEVLYKHENDWLFSLRGLENIAFLKLGSLFVGLISIAIIVTQIWGKRSLLVCWLLFSACNIFCSVNASDFYSENHNYIRTTQKLIEQYGDMDVSVYSTDEQKYIGSMQNYAFLLYKPMNAEMWFLQAGFSEYPMGLSLDRVNFFTINKDEVDMKKYNSISNNIVEDSQSNILYLKFDESDFEKQTNCDEIEILRGDREIRVSCKEKPSNIILVLDGQILPYEYIDGYCIYKFDKEVTNSEDSSLVLYNFKNLTSINIEL